MYVRVLAGLLLGLTCSVAMGQAVEVLDWIGIGGISQDSASQFEGVRSATLPMDEAIERTYFATATGPAGSFNGYYELQTGPGSLGFSCFWDGTVDSASGDGSTDGPQASIGLLIRVTAPVWYDVSALAVIGVGAGAPSNVPLVAGWVLEGFCFNPGDNPQPGQELLCQAIGLPEIMKYIHFDSSSLETSLEACCPLIPDVGSTSGFLSPGDYSIFLQTGAQMNAQFGGGGDAYGSAMISLSWEAPECEADTNGDGILDTGDITTFVGLFLAQDLAADFNGDGIIDIGDISTFVARFVAGC